MTNQRKQLTRKFIFGRWNFRSEEKNIYVIIDRDEVEVMYCDEDDHVLSREIFSSGNKWVSDYLCFGDEPVRYFTGYANQGKMSFGEFSTPGIPGDVKWIHVFSRI
jgi:hypothetical protein